MLANFLVLTKIPLKPNNKIITSNKSAGLIAIINFVLCSLNSLQGQQELSTRKDTASKAYFLFVCVAVTTFNPGCRPKWKQTCIQSYLSVSLCSCHLTCICISNYLGVHVFMAWAHTLLNYCGEI